MGTHNLIPIVRAGLEDERPLEDLVAREIEAAPGLIERLPPVDLRSLLEEMSRLRTEVRAETRASRGMREQLERATTAMAEARERQTAQAAGRAAQERRELARAAALPLIDLADRLERTVRSARRLARPRRRGLRRVADPASVALAEGLELTARRARDHLRAHGVERVATVGQPFDPATMEAVKVIVRADLADGEVVEEITGGYRNADGVLRTAQVVVNHDSRGDK